MRSQLLCAGLSDLFELYGSGERKSAAGRPGQSAHHRARAQKLAGLAADAPDISALGTLDRKDRLRSVKINLFDGLVLLGSCDKIVPGMLMAAARLVSRWGSWATP